MDHKNVIKQNYVNHEAHAEHESIHAHFYA